MSNDRLKFRGKISALVKNSGRWVYWGVEGTNSIHIIDPETIGQWTGLYDRHGTMIFEGDIVQPQYNDIRAVEAKMGERGAYNVGAFNLDNCCIIGNVFESPELVGKVWNRA